MSSVFGCDRDTIRKHFASVYCGYETTKNSNVPVRVRAPKESRAVQKSRTKTVRGAWTSQEDSKLRKAVQEMGTNWSTIEAANILPGRSRQALCNHFHTKLKGVTNVDLDAPMFANPSAFESLQVWYNTPIAFDRNRAANVLATSKVSFVTLCASLPYLTYQQQIVLEKMSKSETLKRFVEALSCAEPLAMHDALELNNRELTHSRKGSVDTDHWAFCIGGDFVPVQIDTMLHSAFKTGCFDIDSIFLPSHCVKRTLSARRSKKIQDIEGILQLPMIQEWCALSKLTCCLNNSKTHCKCKHCPGSPSSRIQPLQMQRARKRTQSLRRRVPPPQTRTHQLQTQAQV